MADYNRARLLAYACIVKYARNVLPIYVMDILQNCGRKIILVPYSVWADKMGISGNMVDTLYSDFARTIKDTQKDHYIIIYNGKKNRQTVRWSVAHELGHILLEHEFTCNGEFNSEDEEEANTFAKFLLAPFPMVKYCRNCLEIQKIFDIGPLAAAYVYNHFHKLDYAPSDYNIESKFLRSSTACAV